MIHSSKLRTSLTSDIRETTFFDRNGDPIRLRIHVLETFGSYTNDGTGETLFGPGGLSIIVDIDFVEGTVAVIGQPIIVLEKGAGIVLQDTGIVIFDLATGEILFEGGPHESLHGEVSLCDLVD